MNKMRFWLQWVVANGLAEVVALGVSSIGVMIVLDQALADPTAMSIVVGGVAVSSIGAAAGAVVGWAQWRVLRGCLTTIRARSWVAATAIGGIVSWLLAAAPNMVIGVMAANTGSAPEMGIAAMLTIALAAGAASGLGLSTPQFFVLRPHVRNAGWWIGANALAWMIVTPLFLTVVDSSAQAGSLLVAMLVMLFAAGFTGALAGCIHGVALVWLLASLGHSETSDTERA